MAARDVIVTAPRRIDGLTLIIGGGFALAEAFESTHFTDWIAANLSGLATLSPYPG